MRHLEYYTPQILRGRVSRFLRPAVGILRQMARPQTLEATSMAPPSPRPSCANRGTNDPIVVINFLTVHRLSSFSPRT